MKFALHGMVTLHSNLLSDIRLAKECGYDGLEIHTDKLWRYINAGLNAQQLKEVLIQYNIEVPAIDIIGGVECSTKEGVKQLMKDVETLVGFASEIGAPTIQLNAFEGLSSLSIDDNIKITAKNIKQIAKMGAVHNIRFQYEGAAWTPIHTLRDCLSLVDTVEEDNFGLVIDFWHFWASRGATPDDIAKLNKNIIFGVHCCGGLRPPMDSKGNVIWVDEKKLRGHFIFPQKEEEDFLPAQDWLNAIKATGYDEWFSGEFLNEQLWEQDNFSNALQMNKDLEKLFIN